MKDPQELEILTQQEIDTVNSQIKQILGSFTKNEITSIKSMILPPMFTFNVLKLVVSMQHPSMPPQQITWLKIKNSLLVSPDIIKRRCQLIKFTQLEDHQVNLIQKNFQQVFSSLGQNIEGKSQLYGSFVHKICKLCLRMRTLLHGSKFLRFED